jgi:hypothetical protein
MINDVQSYDFDIIKIYEYDFHDGLLEFGVRLKHKTVVDKK